MHILTSSYMDIFYVGSTEMVIVSQQCEPKPRAPRAQFDISHITSMAANGLLLARMRLISLLWPLIGWRDLMRGRELWCAAGSWTATWDSRAVMECGMPEHFLLISIFSGITETLFMCDKLCSHLCFARTQLLV